MWRRLYFAFVFEKLFLMGIEFYVDFFFFFLVLKYSALPPSHKSSGPHQAGLEFRASLPVLSCWERIQAPGNGTEHKPNLANTVRIQDPATSWAAPCMSHRVCWNQDWCKIQYTMRTGILLLPRLTQSRVSKWKLSTGGWTLRGLEKKQVGNTLRLTRIKILRHDMYLNLNRIWMTHSLHLQPSVIYMRLSLYEQKMNLLLTVYNWDLSRLRVNNRMHCTPCFCLSELCTCVAPLLQAAVPTVTAASKWMSKPMYQCDYRTSWSKSFYIQGGKHWITICKEVRVACICKVFDYSELFFALIGEDLGDNLIVAWGLRELRKSISFCGCCPWVIKLF